MASRKPPPSMTTAKARGEASVARQNLLSRGFLVDCLRRTVFIAVLTTVLLHGMTQDSNEGVSLFYFSGVAFSCALLITLALAVMRAFSPKRAWLALLWLALHLALIGLMIPFYGILMIGLTGESRTAETLALMAGLNTFFIVAMLRAAGEQLHEHWKRTPSPLH